MLCNAVLVIYKTDMVWVEDAASIATWGRVEQPLSIGNISDRSVAVTIGEQFLELYSQPTVSYTVELASNAPDLDLGDLVDIDSDLDIRCMEVAYEIGSDGNIVRVPSLSTPLQDALTRKRRRLDELITAVGGTYGETAPPLDTGSSIKAGKLNLVKLASWSWSTADDLDNAWDPAIAEGDGGMWGSPFEIEEPCRLYEWVINCRWKDDDDVQLTTGDTSFEIYVDDAEMPVRFFQTVDETSDRASQNIYGAAFLNKGQKIRPVNLVNGAHEQGSISIYAAEPI